MITNTVTLFLTLEFAGAGPDAEEVRQQVERAINESTAPTFHDLEGASAQLAEGF